MQARRGGLPWVRARAATISNALAISPVLALGWKSEPSRPWSENMRGSKSGPLDATEAGTQQRSIQARQGAALASGPRPLLQARWLSFACPTHNTTCPHEPLPCFSVDGRLAKDGAASAYTPRRWLPAAAWVALHTQGEGRGAGQGRGGEAEVYRAEQAVYLSDKAACQAGHVTGHSWPGPLLATWDGIRTQGRKDALAAAISHHTILVSPPAIATAIAERRH